MSVCRRKSEVLFQVFATCCFAFDILFFCADRVNSCGKMWMHLPDFWHQVIHNHEVASSSCWGTATSGQWLLWGKDNFPMSRLLYWILGQLLRSHLLYQCQERCLYALYLADKVWMCKTAGVARRACGQHLQNYSVTGDVLLITSSFHLWSVPFAWQRHQNASKRDRLFFQEGASALHIFFLCV